MENKQESAENAADVSCDPDSLMKNEQDVDEWLLSGVSEHQ